VSETASEKPAEQEHASRLYAARRAEIQDYAREWQELGYEKTYASMYIAGFHINKVSVLRLYPQTTVHQPPLHVSFHILIIPEPF
jgi:hypothetical protein